MTFAADKARLEELYALAQARGVTMCHWNLAGADKDLPSTIRAMVEFLEKVEAREVTRVDPGAILDVAR